MLFHELQPENGTGLIVVPQENTDFQFEGVSGVVGGVLQEDGQWDAYVPIDEVQNGTYVDSFGCVSFSALNCLEMLYARKFATFQNFSDRFTAKSSGTTTSGNTLLAVADSIRKNGVVPESEWPFERGRDEKVTWEEYYKKIPDTVVLDGMSFINHYEVMYEWVRPNPNSMMSALTEAPLQVTINFVSSSLEGRDGIIPVSDGDENHAVVIYGYEYKKYWKMFDSYTKTHKKVAWDFTFFSALKYDVNEIPLTPKPIMQFRDNTLLQEVEMSGKFYLYVNSKLYDDDLAKILASFVMRNNGDLRSMATPVKLKDIAGIPIYNLKNQLIA